jgi:hypothetical protein
MVLDKIIQEGGAAALLVVALAIGCGGSESSVSGTISLDGKPLVGSETVLVTVMFYPEASGAPASAMLDGNGQYSVSTGSQTGLPPGTYSVVVAAQEIVGSVSDGSKGMRNLAAPKYASPKTSGFKAEVKPGANTFDFDLKSDPKADSSHDEGQSKRI